MRIGDKAARAQRKRQEAQAAKKSGAAFVTYAPSKNQTPKEKVAAARRAKVRAVKSAARRRAKKAAFKKLELAGGPWNCAAEAVAASARGSGQIVSAFPSFRSLALEPGAYLPDLLEAAGALSFEPVLLEDAGHSGLLLGLDLPGAHAAVAGWYRQEDAVPVPVYWGGSESEALTSGLSPAWLSWGSWWPAQEFPDAVVTEAWEVVWR